MHANTTRESDAIAKLRLFLLYADFPAGIFARRIATRISASGGRNWEASIEMWKLDSVAPVGPIRRMIAQEAGESDILMIAATAVERPDPAISGWLDTLVNWKLNRSFPGLLAGLLGHEEQSVDASHWLVGHLAKFAERTGMEYVWNRMDRDLAHDRSWLRAKVEGLLVRKGLLPVPV